MDTERLNELLEAVQRGDLSAAQALVQIQDAPGQHLAFANLDHNRTLRTGVPEVVFCQGKTPAQVVEIMAQILRHEGRALATRAAPEDAEAVLQVFPAARYHARARIIALGEQPAPASDAPYVAVATGGTSDIPIADEAALTLEFLGDRVQRVYDVGVAGIHRLLRKRETRARA